MAQQIAFTDSLTYIIVSKICQDVGWHTAHSSTIHALCGALSQYMRKLSVAAVEYANHAGRAQPSLDDLAMAFDYFKIDLNQLQDFVLNVDSSPLPYQLPFYPLPCRQNRAIDNWEPDEERPEYYEEWMPSLTLNKSAKRATLESTQIATQKPADVILDKENHVQSANQPAINGTAQPGDVEHEETATPAECDNHKNKLVLRFSLSKSMDDAAAEDSQANGQAAEQSSEANQTTSSLITSALKKSRAFQSFINSSIYKHPNNPEVKKILRVADTHRLPNTHQSRENSPEPEPQSIHHNGASNDILNHSTLDDKKTKRQKKKKNRISDFDSPFDFFDDGGLGITPSIKVKDLGSKKERKSKSGDSGEKKSKKKFMPFCIKMPGIGMADDNASMYDFADPRGDFSTPKKRQYKKKEKPPKGSSERRGRKPKNSSLKTMMHAVRQGGEFDLEDGELPPSPLSFRSHSISPTKLLKMAGNDQFGENEAAKMLVLMSESNDPFSGDQDRGKRAFDDMDSSEDDSSMADFMNEPSTSKSSLKKAGRPQKRPKGGYSKKIVKSAEVIESSDDSSDDDANIDSNPVSLLPPPPEPVLKTKIELANTTDSSNLSGRKRHHSSSSISSVSSINSSISSSSKHAYIETNFANHEKTEKHKSKSATSEVDLFKADDGKSKELKHKKKKHSKDKEKIREEKAHKKHKKEKEKLKLNKEPKEKHKEKEKEKEKVFKPKLSIKLGLNFDIRRPTGDFDSPIETGNEPMPLDMSLSSKQSQSQDLELPKFFVEKSADPGTTKKKRGPKKKIFSETHSELVFIKDSATAKSSTKEAKTKTPIINVTSRLFDDEPEHSFGKVTKSTSKQKSRDSKTDKELSIRKEPKVEEKKEVSKSKKTKEATLSLVVKAPGEGSEIQLKKEKIKDEPKSSKKVTAENKSCIVIRETITVDEDIGGDGKVWICPKCSLPDDGSPMIGCDSCEDWYHYSCVGIYQTPDEEQSWFCPNCIQKQKQQHKKFDKTAKKNDKKTKAVDNSVTITPIPQIDPNLAAFGSGISFLPVSAPKKQPAVTITATTTSTSSYKPTGRPRGRPRKDSNQAKPQVTITAIPPPPLLTIQPSATPSFSNFMPGIMGYSDQSSANNFENSATNHQSAAKRKKSICPVCNIDNDNSEMIRCETCSQWYHWECVGIQSAPSPDSSWHCLKCNTKKRATIHSAGYWSTEASMSDGLSLTDTKFLAATGGSRRQLQSTTRRDSDVDLAAQQRCGTCQMVSINQDIANWIACDECDQWYHFGCEGIRQPPSDDESWFCKRCIARQKSIANKLAKIKRI